MTEKFNLKLSKRRIKKKEVDEKGKEEEKLLMPNHHDRGGILYEDFWLRPGPGTTALDEKLLPPWLGISARVGRRRTHQSYDNIDADNRLCTMRSGTSSICGIDVPLSDHSQPPLSLQKATRTHCGTQGALICRSSRMPDEIASKKLNCTVKRVRFGANIDSPPK